MSCFEGNYKPTTRYRTITLTSRAPVRINEIDWRVIAHGTHRTIDLRVRQNVYDGRYIIYATNEKGGPFGKNPVKAGRLASKDADLPFEMAVVSEKICQLSFLTIRDEIALRENTVASLPPVDLTSEEELN